jgi:hypothetical protein
LAQTPNGEKDERRHHTIASLLFKASPRSLDAEMFDTFADGEGEGAAISKSQTNGE